MKRWAAVEGVFVALTCVTFARLMGATYGGSNHNPYLVHSLHSAHPDLLAADWLTAQHPSPHPVFSWLSSWGMLISDTGVPFVVANLAASIVFVLLLWWLVRLVDSPSLLSVLMLLVALAGVTRTNDAMGSYVLTTYFQPSTVGGIGFIAAVCAFTAGRYFLSGLLLAFLGAFHLNYLALGFAVFGLAHLGLGRRALASRLLRQLGVPALVVMAFLPFLLVAGAGPDAERARWILQIVRGPHHFIPELAQFRQFLGWHFLAAAATTPLWSTSKRRALLLALAATSTVVGSAAVVAVLGTPSVVAQMFPWRLAPFSVLLCQLIFLVSAFEWAVRRVELLSLPRIGLALPGAWLVATTPSKIQALVVCVVATIVARAMFDWMAARADRAASPNSAVQETVAEAVTSRPWSVTPRAGLLLCSLPAWLWLVTISPVRPIQAASLPEDYATLYEWTRQTDLDALFVIPPRLETFRLHGHRSVVVDWKAYPPDAAGIVEWYRRLELVTGRTDFTSRGQLVQGHAAMERERLNQIVQEFGADYLVLEHEAEASTRLDLPEVFSNRRFVVLSLATLAPG